MAAPVTPNPHTYINTGKKNTAAKFPSPADKQNHLVGLNFKQHLPANTIQQGKKNLPKHNIEVLVSLKPRRIPITARDRTTAGAPNDLSLRKCCAGARIGEACLKNVHNYTHIYIFKAKS